MGDKTDLPEIGEGDYRSGKAFQDAETEFAKNGPVKEKARAAADALDGAEGAALEKARVESGRGDPHPNKAKR